MEKKEMSRTERAVALRAQGYNCAQAVACVFDKEIGLDHDLIRQMMVGFGGGMGNRRGTCGALSGAILLIGLLNRDRQLSKQEAHEYATEIVERFQEENGALLCYELKGLETGKMLASCPQCIQSAIKIAEDVLC